jgi:hypothetical protein
MARMPLADLPPGSTFRLTGRLLNKTAAGMVVEFIRLNGQTVGTLNIAADGTFSGALVIPPADAQVDPLAVAIKPGDVMWHPDNGQTVVARSVGFGPDDRMWSYSLNRQPALSPEGWVKVDHVNPDGL